MGNLTVVVCGTYPQATQRGGHSSVLFLASSFDEKELMMVLVQLCTKPKTRESAFFRLLLDQAVTQRGSPMPSSGRPLWEMINGFLVEDKYLPPIGVGQNLSHLPLANLMIYVYEAVLRRVCMLAGHVWLQYAELLSEDHTTVLQEKDYLAEECLVTARPFAVIGVIEFLPAMDLDPRYAEPNDNKSLGREPWDKCTDHDLYRLFWLFITPGRIGGTDGQNSGPPVECQKSMHHGRLGKVEGRVRHLRKGDLDPAWRRDRLRAWITPAFDVASDADAWVLKVEEEARDRRYSFSPWYERDGDNCLTWALRVLEAHAKGIGNATVVQCLSKWAQAAEQSGPEKGCVPPCGSVQNLRECGRVLCFAAIAQAADMERRTKGAAPTNEGSRT